MFRIKENHIHPQDVEGMVERGSNRGAKIALDHHGEQIADRTAEKVSASIAPMIQGALDKVASEAALRTSDQPESQARTITIDNNNNINQPDRAGFTATSAAIIGLGLLTIGAGLGFGLGFNSCERGKSYENNSITINLPATPSTSEAGAGTGEETTTTVPPVTTTSSTEVFNPTTTTAERVEQVAQLTEAGTLAAIAIESTSEAAARFGADEYSSNPDNWELVEFGGAHLKETDKAVLVRTEGVVLEGWIKSKMVGARDALTVVVNGVTVPFMEVNGGTIWDFGRNQAGFIQVYNQVVTKEAKPESEGGQPDVLVIPICAKLQPSEFLGVPVNEIQTAEDAAWLFGADEYSRNAANWEINEYGGAHLINNPNGEASLVNTNGAVVEGWIRANRENGRPAITFVGHPNVSQMRIDGGTFWVFTDPDKGYQQLLGQVLAKEKIEQPDVNVYPVYYCPTPNSK